MRRTVVSARAAVVLAASVLIAASACASGPSQDAIDADRRPATTTTTEPPPEGVQVVRISNASFRPSNLTLDLDELQIVRWVNEDDREYQIISRQRGEDGERLFESPLLVQGDEWEFDFTTIEPAVHRYFMTLGAQTIPGLVDTRPAQ